MVPLRACVSLGGEPGEGLPAHLAGRAKRQFGQEQQKLGELLALKPAFGFQERAEAAHRQRRGAGALGQAGAQALAEVGVRHADAADLGDRRMGADLAFHLGWADVVAAADDDLPEPAGYP